jgi:hypothetical protein
MAGMEIMFQVKPSRKGWQHNTAFLSNRTFPGKTFLPTGHLFN